MISMGWTSLLASLPHKKVINLYFQLPFGHPQIVDFSPQTVGIHYFDVQLSFQCLLFYL